MELFLENHEPYIKNFVTKLYSCKVVHFTILQKNCILKNMSEKTFRHIFLRKLSPKHYFRGLRQNCFVHFRTKCRRVALFAGVYGTGVGDGSSYFLVEVV